MSYVSWIVHRSVNYGENVKQNQKTPLAVGAVSHGVWKRHNITVILHLQRQACMTSHFHYRYSLLGSVLQRSSVLYAWMFQETVNELSLVWNDRKCVYIILKDCWLRQRVPVMDRSRQIWVKRDSSKWQCGCCSFDGSLWSVQYIVYRAPYSCQITAVWTDNISLWQLIFNLQLILWYHVSGGVICPVITLSMLILLSICHLLLYC